MRKITRRGFISGAVGGALLGGLLSRVCAGVEAKKLNVLFIAVDDLRPQLGCYGQRQIKSPNIDRLAGEGLLFERTYCQQAVCAPSRASLLTGLRPDSTGIYDLNTPVRKALPDVVTLPEHFKKNGYETVSIGKIYHHPQDDMQGWTVEPFRAGTFPKGKWKGRGYLTQEAVEQMQAYNREHPNQAGRGPAFEGADVADNAYPDGANTDRAISELRRLKDKRFFLAMGLYKPHLPFNAPRKYWDMYAPEDINLADNPFAPKNAPSYALTNWGELRNYAGIPKKGACPEDLARKLIHGYYACVSYIDAQVGRLVDELDRLDLRSKTVVILWGDHGWKLGEHGLWCKHTNFELDTHVPMIISVPGMEAAGKRTKALTEYVDIYPTLCEVCGLGLPGHLEGKSMKPLLSEPEKQWKYAALSQYPRGKIMGYTMRTERFRYTEWEERATGRVVARELYDHRVDADENENVVDKDEYRDEVKRLALMLAGHNWRKKAPAVDHVDRFLSR